jgi:hypothetical protein
MAPLARLAQIEPRRGREYIACSDLSVGDILFTVRPLAAVLRHEYLQSFCSVCFVCFQHDDENEIVACDDCHLFSVCSQCSKSSLSLGGDAEVPDGISPIALHKACGECKVLIDGEMLDTTTRMLRRLYHLHLAGEAQSSVISPNDTKQSILSDFGAIGGLGGVDKLETHASSKDRETLLRYREYARTVLLGDSPPSAEAAARKTERDLLDRAVAWIQVAARTHADYQDYPRSTKEREAAGNQNSHSSTPAGMAAAARKAPIALPRAAAAAADR